MIIPTSRGSPANLDAEEALLACCILDESQEVIGKCIDAGLTSDAFFKPSHQILWEAVKAVHLTGGGIDEILIANHLSGLRAFNGSSQLEAVGGHAEINRMTNRVETTAHSRYWLEIVKEKALARRLISQATSIIEGIYQGQTTAEIAVKAEALADLGATVEPGERKETRKTVKLISKMEALRCDLSKPPLRKPPILKLMGKPVAKKGDLVLLSAPLKAGKSSTVAAVMGSQCDTPGDYLGFESQNPHGETVLHLMTEESVEDHWDMIHRTARRANVLNMPDWFHSYHLRSLSSQDRREFLFAKAYQLAKSNPVRMVLMDGAADFVDDVNDQRECKPFVDRVFKMIDELDCVVVCTIHTNPAIKQSEQAKATGWLGTILANKATNVFLLMPDEKTGITTITTRAGRHGKGDKSAFKWNDELKRHASVSLGDGFTAVESLTSVSASDRLAALCRDAFDDWHGTAMPYSLIHERIMQAANVGKTAADNRLKELIRAGLISKNGSLYSRVISL
jgi:hypothetical protein